jgi:hypothetical protein
MFVVISPLLMFDQLTGKKIGVILSDNPVFLGPSLDAEKDLSALCQLWIDSKDLVVKVPYSTFAMEPLLEISMGI